MVVEGGGFIINSNLNVPTRPWPKPIASTYPQVHWFSIVNSLLIVLFLTGMVGMILVRNLHRDITRYNRVLTEEEKQEEREESGWKLVHTDAFRPVSRVGVGVEVRASSCVDVYQQAMLQRI